MWSEDDDGTSIGEVLEILIRCFLFQVEWSRGPPVYRSIRRVISKCLVRGIAGSSSCSSWALPGNDSKSLSRLSRCSNEGSNRPKGVACQSRCIFRIIPATAGVLAHLLTSFAASDVDPSECAHTCVPRIHIAGAAGVYAAS